MQVAAEAGVTPDELVRRIQAEVGSSVTVQSGNEQATEESDEVATFTTIIRYFLLTFAGIALFVGAFVIFNTLSITVAQRTREFATLRTVGASRRQVLGSVIVEALVIGLLASVLGLFAGLGLAIGLNELFVALNLDLPQTDTVFATRTIVVSLLVGTLVTLAAGLSPALRATRVPPIAAVREGAQLPRSALSRHSTKIAAVTVLIAVLALSYALLADGIETGTRFLLLGVGVLALFVGVALLSSRLVVPLARIVGLPARRMGGAAGKLAEGNAMRDPGRTASTAAALMIGIALVTFVGVLAQGLRESNSDAIEQQIQADLVVTSQDGYTEFPAAVGDAAAELDGTELVSNVRQDVAEIDGQGGQPDRAGREHGQRGLRLPLDGRQRPGPGGAGRRRRDPARRRRRGQGPGGRRLDLACSARTTSARTSSSAGSTRAARSIPCWGPRASRRRPSTRSTSGRATASR